ncbi:MAG: hypothetical protein Q4E91_14260 [Lachnospiraceae bacterium]|nr:hypothetical protein [Lachnospiraceae bacterium]
MVYVIFLSEYICLAGRGNYYYFDPVTGVMKTEGTAVRNGVTYAFREDGLSDKVDGLKNASDGSGEGWIKENGKWYYLRDGQKVTNEWLSDGNDKYYVDENGAMCTSGHMIDGYYYLFGGTGVLIRGVGLRTSGGLPMQRNARRRSVPCTRNARQFLIRQKRHGISAAP